MDPFLKEKNMSFFVKYGTRNGTYSFFYGTCRTLIIIYILNVVSRNLIYKYSVLCMFTSKKSKGNFEGYCSLLWYTKTIISI